LSHNIYNFVLGRNHLPEKAMSKYDNPFTRVVKLTIIVGAGFSLIKAVFALGYSLPDLRYVLLLSLAIALSWPRLHLPVNAAEILFFLVLLSYGGAAALLLSALVTIVAFRNLLKSDKSAFFTRLGTSIISAALAGLVLERFFPLQIAQAPSSISLISSLASIAALRVLFLAHWSAIVETLRSGLGWKKFTDGQWVNNFLAYFAAAVAAGIVYLVVQQQAPYIELLSLVVIVVFYFAYHHFKEKYKYHSEELSRLHLRTIEVLATAIDAKDHHATTHAQRLQSYAEGLGKALNLTEPELEGLRAAVLLRDIGKLAVPDYILHKSGHLTEAEIEKVKLHPVIGASMLERVGFPYPLVPAVRHHHEYWDGSGYPDRLRGEAIPITARILAIIDACDEAYSQSANKVAQDKAIKLLLAESGRKYDPHIVRVLLENLPAFEAQISGVKQQEINPYATDSLVPSLPVLTTDPVNASSRYLSEIHQAHQEGTELLYLAQTLSSTLNLEEAVAIIISRISRLIPFETGAIYLCDETGMTAYVAGAVGVHAEKLRPHKAWVGHGIVGQALASGKTVSASFPTAEFIELEGVVQQAFKSMLVYPLTKGERIIGAVSLLSSQPNGFTSEHQRVIAMVEPLAADALFNSMTYLRTEARALTDALTGLPNSRALVTYFDQESNRAERYGTRLAMLMIDLDGFKQVNDTFGHQAGDTVLREIALCLKKELRAGDPLIRYAGDEFIALLPYAEESSINDLIARIQKYLEAYSIILNGQKVHVGASIGYAIYGRDGHTLDELMRVADEGMYRNKALRQQQSKPNLIHKPLPFPSLDDADITLKEAVAS
jgi:diguanylate cyclase (GGDEF)-like protein